VTPINDLVTGFKYESDGKIDTWTILQPNADGEYVGDCDDFALTALYLSTGSLWRFWFELIFGSAKVCYVVTYTGGGHAVLRYKGQYIDNWSLTWVTKENMETTLGHTFSLWLFPWPITAIKMLLGKIKS
jgi:hypothetical protein